MLGLPKNFKKSTIDYIEKIFVVSIKIIIVIYFSIKFPIRKFQRVKMQRAELAELVRAPPAVPVRAAAGVALVHVLLARDALEERVLYY